MFSNPGLLTPDRLDGLLRTMTSLPAKARNCMLVDPVRNFLV